MVTASFFWFVFVRMVFSGHFWMYTINSSRTHIHQFLYTIIRQHITEIVSYQPSVAVIILSNNREVAVQYLKYECSHRNSHIFDQRIWLELSCKK